jgi:hypothetical protein
MAVMDLRSRAAQGDTIVYYAGSGHREASWRDNEITALCSPAAPHYVVQPGCTTRSHDVQSGCTTIEHGAVLYTTDRDFTRFPGLRWVNPLA